MIKTCTYCDTRGHTAKTCPHKPHEGVEIEEPAPAKRPSVIKPTDDDKELLILVGDLNYMVHRYVRAKTLSASTDKELRALSDAMKQVGALEKALGAQ